MKDTRVGENLWFEWDGDGYKEILECATIYYTFEHIDLENELIRRGLASALQRDGVAYSLADAFSILESCVVSQTWVGEIDGEQNLTCCDKDGETFLGDAVIEPLEVTIIEF